MKFLRFIFFLSALGFLCLLYAHYIERKNIKIERIVIKSAKLPDNFAGLRIVHLSDLHMSAFTSYEDKVAHKVNALQPDIIAITGDVFKHRKVFEGPNVVNQLPDNIEQVLAFISKLQAPHGIFLCRGNNDFSDDKEVSDIYPERISKENVTMLMNSTALVIKDGLRIHLLGVDFPGFSQWEANEFSNQECESGRCIGSGYSSKNSYAHAFILGRRETWRDYTYSGRFRQSDPDEGGIGVTFYSQLDRGFDRFYRLRRLAGWSEFVLSPHGAAPHSGTRRFGLEIQPEHWYRFKVHCFSSERGTRIQARVWAEGTDEPVTWQADAVDTTFQFQNGSVGLWSHGDGLHQFDDICVVDAVGDTLFFDDFEDGDTFGWLNFNFEGKAIPRLKGTIPDSEFSILLAHSPDVVTWADTARIDLQLSGHTHGGQVQLPFWGAILNSTKLGRRYAEGLFKFDWTTLYVNRGIGTVLLPIRFFCRPEIAVIDLKPESATEKR